MKLSDTQRAILAAAQHPDHGGPVATEPEVQLGVL
jgi:hypothetical protein